MDAANAVKGDAAAIVNEAGPAVAIPMLRSGILRMPRAEDTRPSRIRRSARGQGRIYQRGGVWYLDLTAANGIRIRRRCSTSREIALRSLKAELGKAEERRLGLAPKVEDCELDSWVTGWLEQRKAEKRWKTWYGGDSPRARTFLAFAQRHAIRNLSEITAEALEKFKRDRLKEVEPATVMAELRVVSKLLADAVKERHLLTNPVREVDKLKWAKKELRALTPEESEKVLKAASRTRLHALVATGLMAGLRREELVFLSWDDVDFRAGLLHVRSKPPEFITKSYHNRTIPIPPRLVKILRGQREKLRSPWCFPSKAGTRLDPANVLKRFKALVVRAKIDKPETVNVHSMRHTYITQTLLSGVPALVVQKCAGHSNLQTTLGYAHTRTEDLVAAMKKSWR